MPGRRNPFTLTNLKDKFEAVTTPTRVPTPPPSAAAEMFTKKGSFVNLTIEFVGAKGLPKLDIVGSADPYFVANIDKSVSFVSTVKSNTLEPIWNETWRILHVPESAVLSVQVLDKDEDNPTDDYVGDFEVQYLTEQPIDKELNCPINTKGLRRLNCDASFQLKIRWEECPRTRDTMDNKYLFDGPIRFSRHNSPFVGALTNIDEARLYSTWKIYLRQVPRFFANTAFQPWNRKYKSAQTIFSSSPTSFAVKQSIMMGHKLLYARTAHNGFGTIERREDLMQLFTSSSVGAPPTRRGWLSGLSNGTCGGGAAAATEMPNSQPALEIPTPPQPPTFPQPNLDPHPSALQFPAAPPPHHHAHTFTRVQPPPSPPRHVPKATTVASGSPGRKKRSPSPPWKTPYSDRIKPTVYTYILSAQDNSFRFSETGAAFFVDYASKHALHANCAETVRYAGEFHLRPVVQGWWDGFDDAVPDESVDWELVIDNNSGTYAPDERVLENLKGLLEFNLGALGLGVVVLDHGSEELRVSREGCRRYALERRGVRKEDLERGPAPAPSEVFPSSAEAAAGEEVNGRGRGEYAKQGSVGLVQGIRNLQV